MAGQIPNDEYRQLSTGGKKEKMRMYNRRNSFDGWKNVKQMTIFTAIHNDEQIVGRVFSPVMLILLCRPQQVLDILGDLLGFPDDVFCAGQTGVRLAFVIVQLWYGAALSHPTAAA